MVETLLADRGIMVFHQTGRLWAEKFCRIFTNTSVIDHPVGFAALAVLKMISPIVEQKAYWFRNWSTGLAIV
ncbi:hypothetical protein [Martelella mediterranea]|uniref:hypothetical protein n=1 Tax=Martelella mediterranea TaxID=293089 RepID=UPI00104BAD7A